MVKLIDLSVPIANNASEPSKIYHSRLGSREGAKKISIRAGIAVKSFPDSCFLTLDKYSLTTHTGTHVDAPIHFGASMIGNNLNQKSITDLPLNWFYGQGKLLDFSTFPRKTNITVENIKNKISDEKINLIKGDILLIRTGMDKMFGDKRYFTDGPGLSGEATNYLVSLGIKVIGIDSYGLDRSFPVMLNEYKETRDQTALWPSHFLGRRKEYVHIERLCNLSMLPYEGFKLSLFPIKLQGADASWIRAVAILGD